MINNILIERVEHMDNQFNIPDQYFDDLDTNVLRSWHHKKRVKRLIVGSSCLAVVCFATISINLFNTNSKDNNIVAKTTVSTHQTTIKQTPTPIANQEVKKSLPTKQIKKTDISSALPTQESYALTKSEREYLENYLTIDNYELVAYYTQY